MTSQQAVLVLGGTGRTGGRVVRQLLDRGVHVRAIVRASSRLPDGLAGHEGLAVVEADLLTMNDADLAAQVRECDAVVSCLGHNISLRGVFGPPHALVAGAMRRVCRAIDAAPPGARVKIVLMSSVSVHRPDAAEPGHGPPDRALLGVLRALVPPVRDNQDAADFLVREVGAANPRIEWACVRPDTLVEGGVSPFDVHESLVSSVFKPDRTRMENVAHFMCELILQPATWARWKCRLPVVVDAAANVALPRVTAPQGGP